MDWLHQLRPLVFVYVSALIMVVGSERIFWYYTDADPIGFVELAAYYSLGVYALLWTMERYRTTGFWSFFVAVPVFGYVVEGVITPVLYEGGPTPVFPVYFTGWHGLLSVVVLWYALRRWLISDRWRVVLLVSLLLGVLWGLQASTMMLDENLADPELAESNPEIRPPLDFLRYAVQTTAVLIGGHLLLGRGTWRRSLGRSRVAEWTVVAIIVVVVALWTIAIPWAGPMFITLLGGVAFVLSRHRRAVAGPTTLEQLDGVVALRSLAMLVPLPAVATAVYACIHRMHPGDGVISAINGGIVATVSVVAAVLMVASWVRVLRPRTTSSATEGVRLAAHGGSI